MNSFGTVIARGAELGCSRTSIGVPRPATPRPRHGRAAPRVVFQEGGCSEATSESKGGRGPSSRARRARVLVKSAPSNKRLKLTGALVVNGDRCVVPWRAWTIVHHPCAARRVARSLSAIR